MDAIARSLADTGLPHPLRVSAARAAVCAGDAALARQIAEKTAGQFLRPVINATGTLLHTNLGRAQLEGGACRGAVNLELDLATGRRGLRTSSVSKLLCSLTGAEAATVVNNGAAALLLVLATLAPGQPVIVSRGELVEIGGGFRIPEVLATSGARLVEVGTTNKTRLADYAEALGGLAPETRPLLLKVHQSNYRIVGFTQSVTTAELATLGVPVVVDLGSGLLDAGTPWLRSAPPRFLAGEPAARQTLVQGAALVTFSGDKLLGGPQAGLIAGSADLVSRCSRNPLFRALRPGGLVLSELQATLVAYAERRGHEIPFWQMATTPAGEIRERAEAIAGRLGPPVSVCGSLAAVGAGSSPGMEIESAALCLPGDHRIGLIDHEPPVVARVQEGRTLLDLRSVSPGDDGAVESALKHLLSRGPT